LSVRMFVCDGGFGGWGRERSVKQRATTTVSASAMCTNQDLISTKHRSCPKGRNDGRIASLSHHTRGRYKNLSLPPPTERKNWQLYGGACFQKFPKLLGTKLQNVRTEVLGFLTPVG
jgi:hypothetical protein